MEETEGAERRRGRESGEEGGGGGGGGKAPRAGVRASRSLYIMAFSSSFSLSRITAWLVSCSSPATMYSSRMAYTLWKLKTRSSSHTLPKYSSSIMTKRWMASRYASSLSAWQSQRWGEREKERGGKKESSRGWRVVCKQCARRAGHAANLAAHTSGGRQTARTSSLRCVLSSPCRRKKRKRGQRSAGK